MRLDQQAISWTGRYAELARQIPSLADDARMTLCGLSTVLDAVVPLHEAGALFAPGLPDAGRGLVDELRRRARSGIGGEYRAEWPDGAEWLDRSLPFRLALGGTGAHAARVLSLLGAPALLSLASRGPSILSVLDGGILLAEHHRPVPAREIAADGPDCRRIYIFESTAGQAFDGIVPPRSTRIIVRLHDGTLEDDRAFADVSVRCAGSAGAGVLSGFSLLDHQTLPGELSRASELARRWRQAGLRLIHLELASYAKAALRDAVLDGLRGQIDSLGMSLSELHDLVPGMAGSGDALGPVLAGLAERFGVSRVCVHADEWAAALTRADPDRERRALMAGCLLAATRAAAGQPAVPHGLPEGCELRPPPEPGRLDGAWLVTCPAPWMARPATTLGLGDTFMAGCLLVLGGHGQAPALDHQTEQ